MKIFESLLLPDIMSIEYIKDYIFTLDTQIKDLHYQQLRNHNSKFYCHILDKNLLIEVSELEDHKNYILILLARILSIVKSTSFIETFKIFDNISYIIFQITILNSYHRTINTY